MVRDYCQILNCCAVSKVGESYVCYLKLGDQRREEDPHKGKTWTEEKKAVKVLLLIFFCFLQGIRGNKCVLVQKKKEEISVSSDLCYTLLYL